MLEPAEKDALTLNASLNLMAYTVRSEPTEVPPPLSTGVPVARIAHARRISAAPPAQESVLVVASVVLGDDLLESAL